MLALLYDVHGNLDALDAVLEHARGRGATRWLIGGDVAAFGGHPAATVQRLRSLPDARWLRGNWERWAIEPDAVPDAPVPRSAAVSVRAALGEQLVATLGALPASLPLDGGGRAWHGSPVSDVRSFLPLPAPDEDELLAGVDAVRLVFGHTHLPFRRIALRDGAPPVELVNPGSVGLPLDGDRRAAYATVDGDGRVEHHRVPYDTGAAIAAVRAAAGDAPWGAAISGALDRACM